MAKNYRRQYEDCVVDVLRNASQYHDAFYRADTFRGPSLHFHRRCISLLHDPLTTERLECVYATLASWGMHRMGSRGSKMAPFGEFEKSVLELAPLIDAATCINCDAITEDDWAALRKLFLGLRVMASATVLVGNSKVMAHLVPNVVPPIDREYTLKYLRGNKNITNDPASEWDLMRGMLEGFFVPVVSDPGFRAMAEQWVGRQDRYAWDTSPMKVVDNLVIGASKVANATNVANATPAPPLAPLATGRKPEDSGSVARSGLGRGSGAVEREPSAIMPLRLERTYRGKGFFNVPVAFERYVSGRDGPIEIYLEESPTPLQGRIDRSSNTNGTPRIHGNKPLRDYFQGFPELTTLRVEMETPTRIRITCIR